MKLADFNQLRKLMQMTTSDSDREALTAIRKANEIIARSDTTWERVFGRLVTVDPGIEPDPESMRKAPDAAGRRRYLGDLLEDVAGASSGSFLDFVADLQRQFEERGTLTPAQVDALERARARERAPRHAGRR